MSVTGYYDGNVVKVDEPLQINQRVLVIPIEDGDSSLESAGGSLHQYANPNLIDQEKDVWRKVVVEKYARQ